MSSAQATSWSPTAAIENFFKTNGDKRVAELRFMDNPWEVLLISTFYVYFCYDLGPHRLMKNRKPFDLVWTVRGFNTFILLLNVWLLKRHFSLLNWGYDSLGCSVSIVDFFKEEKDVNHSTGDLETDRDANSSIILKLFYNHNLLLHHNHNHNR